MDLLIKFLKLIFVLQESWEDDEEKKDVKPENSQKEQPATASTKAKQKPNKALLAKLAQQEVSFGIIDIIFV